MMMGWPHSFAIATPVAKGQGGIHHRGVEQTIKSEIRQSLLLDLASCHWHKSLEQFLFRLSRHVTRWPHPRPLSTAVARGVLSIDGSYTMKGALNGGHEPPRYRSGEAASAQDQERGEATSSHPAATMVIAVGTSGSRVPLCRVIFTLPGTMPVSWLSCSVAVPGVAPATIVAKCAKSSVDHV